MTDMLVIPAINILGGKVVRMRQGDPTYATVCADDPLAVAHRFAADGATRLYVQDVDSMATGRLSHLDEAARIARETGVDTVFGATIFSKDALDQALAEPFATVELRADRTAGTPFLHDALAATGDRLALRLDVRGGTVSLNSTERSGVADPVVLARELVDEGARRLVYSDLNRDGMLGGPNYAGLRALLHVVEVPVAVGGGVAHRDHIRNLDKLGVEAVIIGKALYTGDLSLKGHLDARGCWKD